MKYLDKVKVIKNRKKYIDNGISEGMIGTIIEAEFRDDTFFVVFVDERAKDKEFMSDENNFLAIKDDIFCAIKIEDLKLFKDMGASDELILDAIPKHNLHWWCKVENGFIINLRGIKKNTIPFDYSSK